MAAAIQLYSRYYDTAAISELLSSAELLMSVPVAMVADSESAIPGARKPTSGGGAAGQAAARNPRERASESLAVKRVHDAEPLRTGTRNRIPETVGLERSFSLRNQLAANFTEEALKQLAVNFGSKSLWTGTRNRIPETQSTRSVTVTLGLGQPSHALLGLTQIAPPGLPSVPTVAAIGADSEFAGLT
jgi:hypothetical protein